MTQQVVQGDRSWSHTVRGEVVRAEQAKTGSWFAHAKDDRLWLDRPQSLEDRAYRALVLGALRSS